MYGYDAGGGRGRYNRIKSGGGRYHDAGVFGVENKISTSQEDFSGSRYDSGRHHGEVGRLGGGE